MWSSSTSWSDFRVCLSPYVKDRRHSFVFLLSLLFLNATQCLETRRENRLARLVNPARTPPPQQAMFVYWHGIPSRKPKKMTIGFQQPHSSRRITPTTTGNMLSVGVGGGSGLMGYNSGWQVKRRVDIFTILVHRRISFRFGAPALLLLSAIPQYLLQPVLETYLHKMTPGTVELSVKVGRRLGLPVARGMRMSLRALWKNFHSR